MQVGILGLLGVVFIVLKLTGYIAWAWWLVLLPFYGVFLVAGIAIVLALSVLGMANAGSKRRR